MPIPRFFRRAAALTALTTLVLLTASIPASAGNWRWPIAGQVARTFKAPIVQYGPGHRGVDLGAPVGSQVVAPAAGVVVFNGMVARTPTVVLDHGGLASTYQPVASPLKVGTKVAAGAAIGTLTGGWGHCPKTCLHWGVRNQAGYVDPVGLVRPEMPVLLPLLKSKSVK